MKKSLHLIVAGALITPIVYLLFVYPQLPETVSTHFGIDGKANDWGSKRSLWGLVAILTFVTGLVYLLLCNVHKIDPKKFASTNQDNLQKIGVALAIFLAGVEIWIIRSANQQTLGDQPKFLLAAVGLLLAIIGNYMSNIKPNYFAGIRLPWTLENEDNWRKTHHYASRIWFAGGILIAVCSLIFPTVVALFILFSAVAVMTVIPCVYSFKMYKAQKQQPH